MNLPKQQLENKKNITDKTGVITSNQNEKITSRIIERKKLLILNRTEIRKILIIKEKNIIISLLLFKVKSFISNLTNPMIVAVIPVRIDSKIIIFFIFNVFIFLFHKYSTQTVFNF